MWIGWVEQIVRSNYFQLVGVHDPSEESIKRFLKRGYLKEKQVYRDFSLMLKEVSCEAILISNPADFHAETVRMAAEYDLHMLVEKPFVKSYRAGKKLIRTLKDKKLVVAVVQSWRCKDVGAHIFRAIQEGLLGQIGHIFFRYVRNRENQNYPSYIFEEEYPLLYAMGIHHLDLFRYVLKEEYQSVRGHSFKPPWSLYKSDTGVNLYIKTNGGVPIVYTGTVSSQSRGLMQESLIIEGEKGTLCNESQWLEPPLYFFPKGKEGRVDLTTDVKQRSVSEQYNISDKRILRNFYKAITHGDKLICDAVDGLRSVSAIELARIACKTGKIVFSDGKPVKKK